MKKKHCLDEPEIEKEVKRLFRTDNEAVDVKWQLLTEEELSATKGVGEKQYELSCPRVCFDFLIHYF